MKMTLEQISFALIVVFALVIIALERIYPYSPQKFFRKGFWTDLLLYTFFQSYIMNIIISKIIHYLDSVTSFENIRIISNLTLWEQFLIFFVVHDFYIYWFHRLQHRSRWFWKLHEAHHSVEEVDWLAGSRSHVLEILINQTIEFAPILLFGAAPEIVILKGTVDAVWGMWIHSNIDIRSKTLQYVINGPEMHRWHHAEWNDTTPDEVKNINYSTKLAIWDWIFGTAYLPDTKPKGYGLDDPNYPQNYVGQQLFIFKRGKNDI